MLGNLLYIIIVGLIAGFLAGKVMKGKGFGIIGNIIIGILGAIIGSYLFGLLLSGLGLISSILTAFLGAVVLIFAVGLIKRL